MGFVRGRCVEPEDFDRDQYSVDDEDYTCVGIHIERVVLNGTPCPVARALNRREGWVDAYTTAFSIGWNNGKMLPVWKAASHRVTRLCGTVEIVWSSEAQRIMRRRNSIWRLMHRLWCWSVRMAQT